MKHQTEMNKALQLTKQIKDQESILAQEKITLARLRSKRKSLIEKLDDDEILVYGEQLGYL